MGLSHVFYSFSTFSILMHFSKLLYTYMYCSFSPYPRHGWSQGSVRSAKVEPIPWQRARSYAAMVRIRVFGVQHSVEPGSPHAAFASLVGCSTPEPSWLHAKGTFRPGSHETRESTIPAEPGDISPVNDSINTYLMHNKLF